MSPAIIEKDYYVTLVLCELAKQVPDLLFKGGTSLSKCHKIIDRFSEDIDKENGEAFLIAVSDQIASDAEAFKCEIEETLTHWPVETNRDDKTVVFINREYNHE